MLMLLKILCVLVASSAADSTVYDQRQSGKTNVRVEVKDAVIIAVGDAEFGGDYDYSYDYSDLTIKPSHPTVPTKKPSTTEMAVMTTASNATQIPPRRTTTTSKAPTLLSTPANQSQNASALEAEDSTFTFPTSKPEKNDSGEPLRAPLTPNQIPVVVLQELLAANRPNKFLPVKTMNKQYVLSSQLRSRPSLASAINTEMLPARHCAPGFFLDNHNRCKRISRPARERTHLPIGFRYDHKPAGSPE